MINKFGFRVCSVVGGFIAAAGISLGFFADDIFFLFVSHGILTGKLTGIKLLMSSAVCRLLVRLLL